MGFVFGWFYFWLFRSNWFVFAWSSSFALCGTLWWGFRATFDFFWLFFNSRPTIITIDDFDLRSFFVRSAHSFLGWTLSWIEVFHFLDDKFSSLFLLFSGSFANWQVLFLVLRYLVLIKSVSKTCQVFPCFISYKAKIYTFYWVLSYFWRKGILRDNWLILFLLEKGFTS